MYTKKSALFFINILFITLFSFIAHLALAQEETSTSSENTNTSPVLKPRDERPQIVPNSRALNTEMQRRITNLTANVSNRMEAALARLDAIVLRIESRTQKLKDEGRTVDGVLPIIDEAKASLNGVRIQLEDIDTQVQKTVSSEKPQEEWKNLRQAFATAREDLKSARESLHQAVAEMKKAAQEPGVSEAVQNIPATSEVIPE